MNKLKFYSWNNSLSSKGEIHFSLDIYFFDNNHFSSAEIYHFGTIIVFRNTLAKPFPFFLDILPDYSSSSIRFRMSLFRMCSRCKNCNCTIIDLQCDTLDTNYCVFCSRNSKLQCLRCYNCLETEHVDGWLTCVLNFPCFCMLVRLELRTELVTTSFYNLIFGLW